MRTRVYDNKRLTTRADYVEESSSSTSSCSDRELYQLKAEDIGNIVGTNAQKKFLILDLDATVVSSADCDCSVSHHSSGKPANGFRYDSTQHLLPCSCHVCGISAAAQTPDTPNQYCSMKSHVHFSSFILDMNSQPVHVEHIMHVNFRPYTHQFIEAVLHSDIEIVIFSAGGHDYVHAVVQMLFAASSRQPYAIFSSEHCVQPPAHWNCVPKHIDIVKSMTTIADTLGLRIDSEGLSNVVILDDCEWNFCFSTFEKQRMLQIPPYNRRSSWIKRSNDRWLLWAWCNIACMLRCNTPTLILGPVLEYLKLNVQDIVLVCHDESILKSPVYEQWLSKGLQTFSQEKLDRSVSQQVC